jgi:hypothetical protein
MNFAYTYNCVQLHFVCSGILPAVKNSPPSTQEQTKPLILTLPLDPQQVISVYKFQTLGLTTLTRAVGDRSAGLTFNETRQHDHHVL